MAVHYIDPSAATNGSGSSVNPYNSAAAATLGAGDTVLIRTGTTINQALPAQWLGLDNIEIAEYGTGAKPIITGGTEHAPAEFQSVGAGVWSLSLGGNVGGNALEDGAPMRFVAWAGSAAASLGAETAPCFSFDYSGGVLYVKPSGGAITGKTFSVSAVVDLITSAASKRGLRLRNLALRQASGHGVVLLNRREVLIDALDIETCGGARNVAGAFHYGNGIELANGCLVAEVRNCSAVDIFDSAYTSQLFSTPGARLSDHAWSNLSAMRCGLAAMEIAITDGATAGNISNVSCDGLTADELGSIGWSGNRAGVVYSTYNHAASSGARIRGCRGSRIRASNARRLWTTNQTGGVNQLFDAYVQDAADTFAIGNPGGAAPLGQADLWWGVSNDAGQTPEQGVGGTFVQLSRAPVSAAYAV